MSKKGIILLFLFSCLFILITCKEAEKEMMVKTGSVSDTTYNSARISGQIIDLGEGATQYGHYYSTKAGDNTSGLMIKSTTPPAVGVFTSQLTGLTSGTKYYVKAFISNGIKTVYGNEISFSTLSSSKPAITTTAITSVTNTSATSGGNITNDGGASITSRGVCWNTTTAPTIANSKTSDLTGTGSFVSNLTGLTAGTTYYVRAYAANTAGTAYGNELSFTTNTVTPVLATLSTTAITGITQTSATSGGNITNDGGASITSRGVCWNTTTGPTIANSKTSDLTGTGSFVSNLTGLTAGTIYYVRAYAANSAGTAYGNEVSFTASPVVVPTLTTTAVASIALTSAVSGGNVTSDGGGTIIARGSCWSTSANPTISNAITTDGSGTGSFTSSLAGLLPGTAYYVRAYATNSAGTAYGNQFVFNTRMADAEGNTYRTVTIGTQVWMAENLKTTKYNDGSNIPNVTDNTTWINLTSGAYSEYNNNLNNDAVTYGRLYNWYAVNTGKLCPTGWHVPTDGEWNTFENYLIGNGYNYDGTTSGNKIAKSLADRTLWHVSNTTGAIGNTDFGSYQNKTNFSALPAGSRDADGAFYSLGIYCTWWTATPMDSFDSWSYFLFYDSSSLTQNGAGKIVGYSVRCLKN